MIKKRPRQGLNFAQKERLSEIIGNIAVGWFITGIISPFFLKEKIISEQLKNLGWGMVFSFIFMYLALLILENSGREL